MCADKEAANPSVLVPVHNNVLFKTKLKSNASQFEGQGSRVCAKKKKNAGRTAGLVDVGPSQISAKPDFVLWVCFCVTAIFHLLMSPARFCALLRLSV